MKRGILVVLIILAVAMFSAATSEAGIYVADYPNYDSQVIFDRYSWDGYNHLVMTFNNGSDTASATVLDPYGAPSDDYGFYYFWADFYGDYYDFYGSLDGSYWDFLERVYY